MATLQDEKVEDVCHLEQTETFVIDPVEEKKVLRKIDLYLMPSIFILYLFSFIDRSNIGLAKVAGMQKDLHLNSNEYYLAVIMWVIGYAGAAVPSNMILSRVRPSYYIPVIMFAWGAIAAGLAGVKTGTQLLVLRFFLGVFEAGFNPSVLFMISIWYRRHEQSKRFMIFLSAGILSGAFGGVFAGAITSRLDGAHGIPGWRWFFLVEGVATVGASLIVHWFLLDYPSTSKQLTPAQREIASRRLFLDGITHQKTEGGDLSAIGHAFVKVILNWRIWMLCPAYMTIIGALAISNFYPTLVEGLGYTSTNAQYMTAPLYLVALVIAIPASWYADRNPHLRGYLLNFTLILLGGLFSELTAGILDFKARYIFLCLINSAIWTGNCLGLSFTSTALGGCDTEVRAIALPLINGCGGLAQLYGSALFPAEEAPRYLIGFSVFAACFVVGGMIYLAAVFLFKNFPFVRSSTLENDE
ncbi:MFS general substrate transporter [Mollisia scopiformis]|uniref:MFS general substrate transporter n=1 Tax=Mollisia scopiformis TaxID=149040 RepID=A0A194XWA8_MOLSC|nr:MFS general substrate transporter [Mollisia scopiformis]KUJ24007.1 MFS general substrate transporter [Mollisia scopiformis]